MNRSVVQWGAAATDSQESGTLGKCRSSKTGNLHQLFAIFKLAVFTSIGNDIFGNGGINAGNLSTYLSCDKVVACGGSWMVKGDLVKAGKYEEITRLAKEAVNLVAEIRK